MHISVKAGCLLLLLALLVGCCHSQAVILDTLVDSRGDLSDFSPTVYHYSFSTAYGTGPLKTISFTLTYNPAFTVNVRLLWVRREKAEGGAERIRSISKPNLPPLSPSPLLDCRTICACSRPTTSFNSTVFFFFFFFF